MNKIKFRVDGYLIEAKKGQNILEASLEAGIYIPHLCHHPDLKPQGGCKMCSVQVEGRDDIVQSCMTPAEEGMVVQTKTEKVKQLRVVALELMLASHPKDCTSCDKYLNCELQAMLQYMGVAHSRLREIEKENTKVIPSDRLIKREMHRCIQCGRCVRACDSLRGIGALCFNQKNGESYVGTKGDKPLNQTDCRFCGACVEVCPTGAIQDALGVFSKTSPRAMALVPCKDSCPAHTDIPTYIRLTEEGEYSEAVAVLREKLTFPHSLGYICSHACESGCKRNKLDEALSIREIKRFAVENDKNLTWRKRTKSSEPNGKKVAVVGGGPAGMTGAYYLAKKGYDVTVFEKEVQAGGMLSYGIPKYRLAQSIVDSEIDILKEEGVKLCTGVAIDSLETLKKQGFDAILVAVGAGKGSRPKVYNQTFDNAFNAVDFCNMAIKGLLPPLGETVTVFGGGNVAFDCARTAKKNGVKNVRVLCLEARENMLADKEEIACGLEEGIEILNGRSIVHLETEGSRICGLEMVSVSQFKFGPNGLEIETVPDSSEKLFTDSFIFATGQAPNLTESFGLELVRGSFVRVEKDHYTSDQGTFAAGDAVYGTKSVVEAIASGRSAASEIDKYLGGDGQVGEVLYDRKTANPAIGIIENFAALKRQEHLHDVEESLNETRRCLQCDLRLDIQKVKYWVDPHFKKVKEVR